MNGCQVSPMKNVEKIRYFKVPEWKAVFKVTEDCCFEKVVYEGTVIGVTGKIDQDGDLLNSWDLLCYTCNPDLEILPIDEEQYQKLRVATICRLKKGLA